MLEKGKVGKVVDLGEKNRGEVGGDLMSMEGVRNEIVEMGRKKVGIGDRMGKRGIRKEEKRVV